MTLDDLTAHRIRRLFEELEELAPDAAETLLTSANHGPLLREALGPSLARWTCPLCATHVDDVKPPAGWLIVQPFTRVAACDRCRPMFVHRIRARAEA